MTSKEFGVKEPSDLLELEDNHMEELKESLPKSRQRKFVLAIDKLKVLTTSLWLAQTFAVGFVVS